MKTLLLNAFTLGIAVVAIPTAIQYDEAIDLSHLGTSIYGRPDEQSGENLNKWNPDEDVNAEEVGEYTEGDILVPTQMTRSGLKSQASRWPDGIIPYEIQGNYNTKDMNTIKQAIEDFHKMTCIKFVPRTASNRDYLSITNSGSGCWSSVGRIGGRQQLNLQSPGCLTKKGTVIHEFMHAVGFLHEQNRSERDSHVTIVWANIQRGRDNNFQKAKKETTDAFGVNYDYRSVMHYSANAFSANGKQTIITKIKGVELGQREGFSRHDVLKVKRMYNCTT